jgi:hypothetical protein
MASWPSTGLLGIKPDCMFYKSTNINHFVKRVNKSRPRGSAFKTFGSHRIDDFVDVFGVIFCDVMLGDLFDALNEGVAIDLAKDRFLIRTF